MLKSQTIPSPLPFADWRQYHLMATRLARLLVSCLQ
jgi:hypothetical protein